MKLLLTIWNQRIAPVFDVAGTGELVTIDKGIITAKQIVALPGDVLAQKVRYIAQLGVDELICGAISRPAEFALRALNIPVAGFVTGDIDTVIDGWLHNRLNEPHFIMPGCGQRRRCHGQHGARCRHNNNENPKERSSSCQEETD
ncbi:MAG: hypothetical protein EOL87_09105 [Spartobacteria bacterium]|nr:hypothetical protein [Spartobacteria bacterium]